LSGRHLIDVIEAGSKCRHIDQLLGC